MLAALAWLLLAAAAALPVGYAVVCALNLQVDTIRDDGPRWSDEVDNARTECLNTAPGSVDIPITPDNADWTTGLPCSYIPLIPGLLHAHMATA